SPLSMRPSPPWPPARSRLKRRSPWRGCSKRGGRQWQNCIATAHPSRRRLRRLILGRHEPPFRRKYLATPRHPPCISPVILRNPPPLTSPQTPPPPALGEAKLRPSRQRKPSASAGAGKGRVGAHTASPARQVRTETSPTSILLRKQGR